MGLHVPRDRLKEMLNLPAEIDYGPYCEEFLKAHFGAATVDSFDKSDYEHATHLADFNEPIEVGQSYETIIDGGSLEHIFNVPQALENISKLCAVGGQIMHVLPANNLCGHGFWQFSPDLFLSLYSEANGYDQTIVFLAEVSNEQVWYEVRKPPDGKRIEIASSSSVFVLVKTRKIAPIPHQNVQQSDYVQIWNDQPGSSSDDFLSHRGLGDQLRQAAKKTVLLPAARILERKWQRLIRPGRSLSSANPHLMERSIATLT
jgi:hypothetical protein